MKLRQLVVVAVALAGCKAQPTTAADPADDVTVQPKSFTLGSTHEEVRAAMGPPTGVRHVIDETWSYDFSAVDFDGAGKVIAWHQRTTDLATRLDPHDRARFDAAKARGTWSVGSTKDEVLAVQGVPTDIDRVIHDTWRYDFSSVEFDDAGTVVEYHQATTRLHVR